MIQANELRIGNKILANGLYGGKLMTVNQIGECGTMREGSRVIIFKEINKWGEFVNDCDGIPLTPEILEKCGFIKKGDEGEYYHKDADLFGLELNYETYAQIWDAAYTGIEIKYLHHLQNCFYFLTGTELEINL